MPEEGPIIFSNKDDFWGYRWIGHCYYIESREEDMLFGDGLSKDLATTKQYCRAANIAHSVSADKWKEKISKIIKANGFS